MTQPEQRAESRRKNLGQRFEERLRYGVAKRGAFPYLVTATALIAVLSGALARLTAHEDFPSYGDGVWWALVTITTVGYGDIVPHTIWGRMIGGFVMICGVTFLSFLTATVTSMFIAQDESTRDTDLLRREAEVRAILMRLEERLAAIDARLSERGGAST